MKSETSVASVRTGVNLTVFSALASLFYKIFHINVSVDDLLIFSPVIGIVGGVFYRASRFLAEKYPGLGYVLFGTKKTPTDYEEK